MRAAVLLVDQKQNTAGIIKTYLTAGGYSVDHTPDPAEALEFAAQARYGVVITDLVLPGMTGFDLYREIRSYDDRIQFVFLLTPSGEALRLMGTFERKDVINKEPLSINKVIQKVRAAFHE